MLKKSSNCFCRHCQRTLYMCCIIISLTGNDVRINLGVALSESHAILNLERRKIHFFWCLKNVPIFYIACRRKARLCSKLPEQGMWIKRRCIEIINTQDMNLTAEKSSDGKQLVEYGPIKDATGKTKFQSTRSCHWLLTFNFEGEPCWDNHPICPHCQGATQMASMLFKILPVL